MCLLRLERKEKTTSVYIPSLNRPPVRHFVGGSYTLFSPTPSRAPRRPQRRLTEPRRTHRRAGGGATGAPSRKARSSKSGIRHCRSSYDQNLRWAPPWTARQSWPQPPWPGFCCRRHRPRPNVDYNSRHPTVPSRPFLIRKSDYNSQHALCFLE